MKTNEIEITNSITVNFIAPKMLPQMKVACVLDKRMNGINSSRWKQLIEVHRLKGITNCRYLHRTTNSNVLLGTRGENT